MRHQRTGDTVFDYYDFKTESNHKPCVFVYNLIETLLPKANFKQGEKLKMMEMYFNYFICFFFLICLQRL